MRTSTANVLTVLFLAFLCFAQELCGAAEPEPTIYSTWENCMEVDKCGSAWLIARFVDKNAQFKFYEQGALDMEGIPFDVPTAELRSGRDRSTFEAVVAYYKIDDPAVAAVAKVIREIELNVWSEKSSDLAASLPKLIEGIRLISKNDHECLKHGFVLMDALYAYINKLLGD